VDNQRKMGSTETHGTLALCHDLFAFGSTPPMRRGVLPLGGRRAPFAGNCGPLMGVMAEG
jgi:hypothetical protein